MSGRDRRADHLLTLVAYDSFEGGAMPVSTRGGVFTDADRGGHVLPYEVWYPEGNAANCPLIVFSHTSNGQRLQSTFLCRHLASHGYVVAAVDHVGNTAEEAAARAASGKVFTPSEREAYIDKVIGDRVPDLRFLIDQVATAGQPIGLLGWSFGGWAVLAFPEVDKRGGAIVAMAPGGNSKPLPGIIPAQLTFDWKREIPTLFLVAELDQYTPMPGQRELLERTPSTNKRMFVLRGADHGHFGDQIDEPGGCSAEAAHTFTRGLVLAHFDAALKANLAAEDFLAHGALHALTSRGVPSV